MKKMNDMIDSISQHLKKCNDIFSFCKNIKLIWTFIAGAVLFVVGLVIDEHKPEYLILYIVIIIGLVLIIIIIVLSILLFKSHSNKIEGTFAVSAFIFYDKDNKLLLRRSENKSTNDRDFYVQPSVFYRKKYRKKCELPTPYKKIYDYLKNDLALYMEHLTPISSLPLEYDHQWVEQKLSNFISRNKEVLFPQYGLSDVESAMRKYQNNEISLSPLLTIVEKNPDALKSSGEKFHIDFYFAFRLNEISPALKSELESGKFNLVSRVGLTTLLDNQETHGDLLAIYDILHYLDTKSKVHPKVQINNCTFSCRKKTAYWRITKNCNCICNYCFIEENKIDDVVDIDENTVDKVIQVIETRDIEKLVISGGEPLLVRNLVDIIQKINDSVSGKLEISVCTNGVVDFSDFEKLSKISKFEKFVISIDGYDQNTYGKYKKVKPYGNAKKPKSAQLGYVKQFIECAQQYGINVAVNTIISKDLVQFIDKYIDLYNDIGIEELSFSKLITNNKKNRKTTNFVTEVGEVLKFYNMVLNDKIEKFYYVKRLDFIIPSCTYSTAECECLKKKQLYYIDPNGNLTEGCVERATP